MRQPAPLCPFLSPPPPLAKEAAGVLCRAMKGSFAVFELCRAFWVCMITCFWLVGGGAVGSESSAPSPPGLQTCISSHIIPSCQVVMEFPEAFWDDRVDYFGTAVGSCNFNDDEARDPSPNHLYCLPPPSRAMVFLKLAVALLNAYAFLLSVPELCLMLSLLLLPSDPLIWLPSPACSLVDNASCFGISRGPLGALCLSASSQGLVPTRPRQRKTRS